MTANTRRAQRGINRNIVECKVIIDNNGTKAIYVLIETSWNVKVFVITGNETTLKY